ncbi:MAG: ATP-dependent helicase HrpB [Hyphomicrobiales bacterium]|nr:ATP-dependent helicase HrpB [Hyphomicrobiales bacterium]MBV8827386.1 ATP-dependent helicase HrpB [Hyphomicrobiales bacterium]MBV9427479.1 ATP-dependent helicase HrpB [Bradyrhizobiaceae bacterium]
MPPFAPRLPIDAALPELTAALARANAAVLVAPPGAGKTTRVPLVLAREPWAQDKTIIVLEPRRLAARAAAERMAQTLGESVGATVGLRVRFGSKVSRSTRIEVVTEGVFTRMILDDPALDGVAAVLFDEFHERSLDADLGLALARDAQTGLREDLRLLVLSATLDGARVAALLDNAPVIASEGRAFPVETRYLGRDPRESIERQVADAAAAALRAERGSVLAFLPGGAEIRRAQRLLAERVTDASVDIVPLYGALDRDVQDRAIAPASAGRRKVVLATSIAETSITIEGVRIVIDSGVSRVPRYEPDVGLTRLETVRVSRASADQRRGRAGRTEPGVCLRLWDEPQTASLEPYARPEILAADLSGFALDLARWGENNLGRLAFLDPPPKPALSEARALLRDLGAIDADGWITEEGAFLARLPLPPRLGRMVMEGVSASDSLLAAEIAAVVSERGLGGDDVDLTVRLDAWRRDRSQRAEDARQMARRWAVLSASSPSEGRMSAGLLLALAYPDRIARNRGSGSGAFLLANGRGANVDPASALARERFLAVAELAGTAAQGRIMLAAPIALAEIESWFGGRIESREEIVFDPASASLRGRRWRRLGAIVLAEERVTVQPEPEDAEMLAAGIIRLGLDHLPWTKALAQWRDRVLFLRQAEGAEWPDVSDAALAAERGWLVAALTGKRALAELSPDELTMAVTGLLPWNLRKKLETEAPTHFVAPTGSRVPIDYAAPEGPKISVRVQELFGLDRHPAIAGGRVPLVVELVSPAHRPVQVTRDLPGFWRGSYQAVKAEMKGRYPRHPWPDDPLAAPPTRWAKPRGG